MILQFFSTHFFSDLPKRFQTARAKSVSFTGHICRVLSSILLLLQRGMTVVHYTTSNGHIDMLRRVLSFEGLDINQRDKVHMFSDLIFDLCHRYLLFKFCSCWYWCSSQRAYAQKFAQIVSGYCRDIVQVWIAICWNWRSMTALEMVFGQYFVLLILLLSHIFIASCQESLKINISVEEFFFFVLEWQYAKQRWHNSPSYTVTLLSTGIAMFSMIAILLGYFMYWRQENLTCHSHRVCVCVWEGGGNFTWPLETTKWLPRYVPFLAVVHLTRQGVPA